MHRNEDTPEVYQQQEQQNDGRYYASAHEVCGNRVSIVTHMPEDGGVFTKVWFGDEHAMERYKLIADINMETGEVRHGERLDEGRA